MFDGAHLVEFVTAVTVLVLVPGPNTMLILAHSAVGGRLAGLATVIGIESGTLVHVSAAALGLSALLSTSAVAFDVVKYAGAAYLSWLGLRGIWPADRRRTPAAAALALTRAYGRAVLTNVLNPRVAVFFLAFLPHFVRPERGHVVLQFGILGLIVVAVGLLLGSALVLASSSLAGWLRRPAVSLWLQRSTGLALVAFGLRLALGARG